MGRDDRIRRFLDGEMDAGERAEFERERTGDRALDRDAAVAQRIRRELQRTPVPQPRADLADRVMARVRTRSGQKRRRRALWPPLAIIAAALCAALLALVATR